MRKPFDGINRVTQRWSAAHYGMDIVGDTDKTVRSVCAGIVRSSNIITNKKDPTWEWGNYVRVDDASGRRFYYCHLAKRLVFVPKRVSEGDALGIMGNTGKSRGAHLHLQIRDKNGKELNVAEILEM